MVTQASWPASTGKKEELQDVKFGNRWLPSMRFVYLFMMFVNNFHFIMVIYHCLYFVSTPLQNDTISTRRACILRALSVYLNEDYENLMKEYAVSVLRQ